MTVKAKLEEVYAFIDGLREAGTFTYPVISPAVSNIRDASPYIEQKFEVTPSIAKQWLMNWMTTFDDRHPKENPSKEGLTCL